MNKERVSELQLEVLRWLDEQERGDIWGVCWRPARDLGLRGPSERAVLSRALARLERRGYLLRQNEHNTDCRSSSADHGPVRATHVKLLPAGKAVLDRLTKTETAVVSRPDVGGGS